MSQAPELHQRDVVVFGTPVSLQSKSDANRQKWIDRVREAARKAIGEDEQLSVFEYPELQVWVVYFHFGEMEGDIDNIIKPILDGMTGPGWTDDRQIARLTMRRIRLDVPENQRLEFIDPPQKVREALESALQIQQEFVYILAQPDALDQKLP